MATPISLQNDLATAINKVVYNKSDDNTEINVLKYSKNGTTTTVWRKPLSIIINGIKPWNTSSDSEAMRLVVQPIGNKFPYRVKYNGVVNENLSGLTAATAKSLYSIYPTGNYFIQATNSIQIDFLFTESGNGSTCTLTDFYIPSPSGYYIKTYTVNDGSTSTASAMSLPGTAIDRSITFTPVYSTALDTKILIDNSTYKIRSADGTFNTSAIAIAVPSNHGPEYCSVTIYGSANNCRPNPSYTINSGSTCSFGGVTYNKTNTSNSSSFKATFTLASANSYVYLYLKWSDNSVKSIKITRIDGAPDSTGGGD